MRSSCVLFISSPYSLLDVARHVIDTHFNPQFNPHFKK
jgi:hypothetical protein